MKKISIAFIVLLLVVGVSFNFYGGNASDIGGSTAGTSKEVYVINDNENYHNAGVRIQTKSQSSNIYRDWLIYNQGNTGDLRFGFWDGSSHSNSDENDYEKVPMEITSAGHLTIDGDIYVGQDRDMYNLDILSGHNDLRFQAQTGGGVKMLLKTNGNFGIGNTNPQQRLHVNGNTQVDGNVIGTSLLTKTKNNGTADYVGMKADGGNMILGSDGYIRFNETDANATRVLFDLNNNKVGIATETLSATLNVGGTIASTGNITTDGNITANNVIVGVTSFPDYVFAEDYNLLSLEDLKEYINEHKHLPNIPAASEIEKGGMDLGKINVLLTEKVEELTLYTIAQDEKLKEQDEALKSMKEELEMLKTMIITKQAIK